MKNIFFLLTVITFFAHASKNGNLLNKVNIDNIASSYTWLNLIHINNNKPSIVDARFLYSHANFTPSNELRATIYAMLDTKDTGNKHAICRFPARYKWIRSNDELSDLKFPKVSCKDLDRYYKSVSFRDIKINFAVGDVSDPASMLGHIFFKVEGNKLQEVTQEHAVSFFTTIDSYNMPIVIIQALATGMKGFFSIRPHSEQSTKYLYDENRDIWEYDLNLSSDQKKLIYLHFWELKNIKIKYYYIGFNCATIIHNMLSMVSNKYAKIKHRLITPKTILRDAAHVGIINKGRLLLSLKNRIYTLSKMLYEVHPHSKILKQQLYTSIDTFKKIDYAKSKKIQSLEMKLLYLYSQYIYFKEPTDYIKESIYRHSLNIIHNKELLKYDYQSNEELNKSIISDPMNSRGETKIRVSRVGNDADQVVVSFMPASNTLYDDNRDYIGEGELKLFETSISFENNQFKLQKFVLFSIKSLQPWSHLIQNNSYSLLINYDLHLNQDLQPFQAYNLSIGKGQTWEFDENSHFYWMLNFGVAYGNKQFYPYIFPEIGCIVYPTKNSKSVMQYSYYFNQDYSESGYHEFNFNHIYFIDQNWSINIGIDHKANSNNKITSYTFGIECSF